MQQSSLSFGFMAADSPTWQADLGVAPKATYPRQLEQAVGAIKLLTETLWKPYSNLLVGADSARGSLTAAVLAHLSHPHPSIPGIPPRNNGQSFRGAVFLSPWLKFDQLSPSFSRNAQKDCLGGPGLRKWADAYMNHALADFYNEPLEALEDWWQDVAARHILILAGEDEILLDDIVPNNTPNTMASSNGSVFSETLQEITNTKLEELSKRRSHFENIKADVIARLEHEKKPIDRLVVLSQGVKECCAIKTDKSGDIILGQSKNPDLEFELKNLEKFLAQSKYDPSVSPSLMHTWEQSLLHHLNTQSLKFQYASLYAQLVTEWLSTEKAKSEEVDMAMAEGFEDLANEMKRDSRIEWERVVFEPASMDKYSLNAYLNSLFGFMSQEKTASAKALEKLRQDVISFEITMAAPKQFDSATLSWISDGLLASDLLTDEKREVLRDFKNNPVILGEIADVLNMRLGALDSWSWGHNVPLEQRRKISGIYNILMHEDLLQAIFLHYIGVKWSVFLKGALKRFRNFNGAWKSSRKQISKLDVKRRAYYLGPESQRGSVQATRDRIYRTHYFMANLMDSDAQQQESLEGEEAAEYKTTLDRPDMQMQLQLLEQQNKKRLMMARAQVQQPQQSIRSAQVARTAMPSRNESYDPYLGSAMPSNPVIQYKDDSEDDYGPSSAVKRPMEDKQRLIRLLSTEIAINTKLYGEVTAFHSVFDNWNSLLPHETILSVLTFFGFSPTWIQFFTKFLKAPLRFMEDGESVAPRIRQRGTPASHVLSEIFGELILFCLDFSVNQSTGGNLLFRMHDDLWFWSRDHSSAVTAWKSVTDFVNATGTYINPTKAGTVRISADPSVSLDIDRSLPVGDIRWGFLKLSTETGKFEIDQTMVDSHIVDLRKQLRDKRKSIITFIQAWNTYAGTFFTSNFGKPANCFGRDHVDQMLATHKRIQHEIFSPSSSSDDSSLLDPGTPPVTNVVEYLKTLVHQRFGVSDIPDAYLFFPMELGGLDLRSPFVSIMQVRGTVPADPSRTLLDAFFDAERDAYAARKAAFERGRQNTTTASTTTATGRLYYPAQSVPLHHQQWEPETERERETFMSFAEFARYREDLCYSFDGELAQVYKNLLEQPREESVAGPGPGISAAIQGLDSASSNSGIHSPWGTMEPYWKWVAQLYGPEVIDRFGGLTIVEPGLLPMGMVTIFRDKRVTWQG
ncbi:hypothetical protein F4810DRAFT_712513 [Camillea tinctor]|nr:hypothetical protein F4810DRAFT_712513 [Camillea tinctor]